MQVFVDESERQLYFLGAVLLTGSAAPARAALRALCRPGQRRVHFAKEQDSRRRALLSAITGLGVRARVYSSPRRANEGRAQCLTALIADVVSLGARRLVIEGRAGMDHLDALVLDAALRKHGTRSLQYEHLRPYEEPLLWASDAVAWAVGAGGEWRRRVEPMLEEVVSLGP